jgi:hypothetical protein
VSSLNEIARLGRPDPSECRDSSSPVGHLSDWPSASTSWSRPRSTRSKCNSGKLSWQMIAFKLALAIFLYLATEISLASSNNTPPTPQIIEGKCRGLTFSRARTGGPFFIPS